MLLTLAVAALVLQTGCATKVRFPSHAPYQSPARYDAPLLIIVPDNLPLEEARIRAPGLILKRKIDVHYGEALQTEAVARFKNMFGEVAVLSESWLEAVENPDSRALDDLLPSQGEIESENLEDIQPFLEFVPEFVKEERGYELRLTEPAFAFLDDRASLMVTFSFRDRFLGQELASGRILGNGSRTRPSQANDVIQKEIAESVRQATTELYIEMRNRMIAGIEEGTIATSSF